MIRQSKVFIALMEQFGSVNQYVNTSLTSQGSAMNENSKFVESLEGKVNQLKSAWEKLATTTINSEMVKNILDMTTGMIKLVDAMGGLVPIMTTILGLIIAIKSQAIIGALVSLPNALVKVATTLSGLTSIMGGATIATGGLSVAISSLLPVAGLALVATSLLTGAVKSYNNAQKEAREKTEQKIAKNKEELTSVNNLVQTYQELKDSVDSDSVSREKLQQVQKDLVKALGDEAVGLDLINGKYEENIAIINKASEAKKNQMLSDIRNTIDTKKQDSFKGLNLESSHQIGGFEDRNRLAKVSYDMGQEFGDKFNSGFVGSAFKMDFNASNLQELVTMQSAMLDKMANANMTDTSLYENLSKGYEIAKVRLEELNGAQSDYNILVGQQTTTDLLREKGLKSTTVITKSYYDMLKKEISNNFRSYGASAEAYQSAMEELNKRFPEFANGVKDSNEQSETFEQTMTKLSESNIKAIEDVKELNEAINSLNDGQTLTSDTILSLLEKYPQLYSAVENVNGVYSLNVEALKGVRDETSEGAKAHVDSEIKKTEETIKQIKNRSTAYQKEIESIQTVADAQKILAEIANSSPIENNRGMLTLDPKGNKYSKWSQEVKDSATKDIGEISIQIGKLESLKQELMNIDIGTSGSNTKKGSNMNNKNGSTAKDKANQEKELFDARIAQIKEQGEKIQYAIEFNQKKIELAEIKGDRATADKLKVEQQKLYADRLKATVDMVRKMRDLKTQTSNAEIKATVQREVDTLDTNWWDNRNAQQKLDLDLMSERYEKQQQLIDLAMRELDLKQQFYSEGSDGYKAIEEQKMQLILNNRAMIEEKISEMRRAGIQDDSEYMEAYFDAWYSQQENYISMMRKKMEKENEERKKTLQTQQEAINNLISMTINLIKQENAEKKKGLQAELEGYKKIINAKKESLKQDREEQDFKKELKDKEKSVKDIEDKLASMQFDTSEKAKADKLLLEEQLIKAKEELNKLHEDKTYNDSVNALDKEYESFEDNINKEIKAIDDYLSKEGQLRADALKRIEKGNKELFNKLMAWNLEYGDGSKKTIEDLWTTATNAMQPYLDKNMSLLDIMKSITSELKNIENVKYDFDVPNTPTKPQDSTSAEQKKINEMKANSAKWGKASPDEKKRLHEKNAEIAKSIGAYWDAKTSRWYRNGLPLYHSGGIVSNPMTKSMEQLAILMEGELVTTDKQAQKFMKETLPSLMNIGGGQGVELNVEKFISIEHMDSDVDTEALVDQAVKQALKTINNSIRNKGQGKSVMNFVI